MVGPKAHVTVAGREIAGAEDLNGTFVAIANDIIGSLARLLLQYYVDQFYVAHLDSAPRSISFRSGRHRLGPFC